MLPYSLWWFIFSVNLTGRGMPRFTVISGWICEGVSEWDLHLNWWLSKVDYLPQCEVSIIQTHWRPEYNTRQRKEGLSPFLLPHYLRWEQLISSSPALRWGFISYSPGSQAFKLRRNYTPGLSWGFQLADRRSWDFSASINVWTKFFIINFLLYLSI